MIVLLSYLTSVNNSNYNACGEGSLQKLYFVYSAQLPVSRKEGHLIERNTACPLPGAHQRLIIACGRMAVRHMLLCYRAVTLPTAALLALGAACPGAGCTTDPLLLSALHKYNLRCKSGIKMRPSILPESNRQLHPC